ncbi:MAG TPA: hypothetical protein VHZ73_13585, partial [Vicinamibacterales bacterium]|nr:hypothetical protein [Vicinamibacterales bacterium]
MTAAVEVPLEVPAPPPRATEPITADALPPVGAPLNDPTRTNAPRPARPPAPQTSTTRPDGTRPDVPAVDTSRPADDAGKPPAPAVPAATLQTTPAQEEPEVEAR